MGRTYHARHFIFSFTYLICCLFRVVDRLSWLPVSFLLHVKYTLSYRIVLQVDNENIVVLQLTVFATVGYNGLDWM